MTIALKYDANSVCARIDEAIASGWAGMNLETMPAVKRQAYTAERDKPYYTPEEMAERVRMADIYPQD